MAGETRYNYQKTVTSYIISKNGSSIAASVAGTVMAGNVTGPASSTDHAIVRWNGATGRVLQNSTATLTDGGALTATSFSGGNVTSGADPGHTHTAYPLLAHTHAGAANGPKLAQANTHETADTDSATTALHHTLGTGANQAASGNDSRLSDARTPTSHAASHNGGADPVTPVGIGALATAATGALGNLGATPSNTLADGTTYSATVDQNITTWAGLTIASGAGAVIKLANSGQSVATTGLTAIASGALADIAGNGAILTIANIGGTYYARASLPA